MRKRGSKEINVFNIAMLDVLTGALGAFMFLMLGFLPFYNVVMQVGGIEKVLELIKNQNEDLTDQLEDAKRRIKELEDEVALLKKQIEELKKENEELRERLKKLADGDITAEELAKLQDELARLREEKAKLESLLQKAEAEIEQLKAENQRLAQENTELKAKLQKLSDENAQLKADLEQLKQKYQVALQKIKELENEIAELKKKLQESQTLRSQVEALQQRLNVFIGIDPEKYKLLDLKLSAVERQILVLTQTKEPSKVRYEFLVRDPDGFWFDVDSNYPLGRKAVVMTSKPLLGSSSSNAGENLRLAGFLKTGTYLLCYRRHWSSKEEPENDNPANAITGTVISFFALDQNPDIVAIPKQPLASKENVSAMAEIEVKEKGKGILNFLYAEGQGIPSQVEKRTKLEEKINSEKIDPIKTFEYIGPLEKKSVDDKRGDLVATKVLDEHEIWNLKKDLKDINDNIAAVEHGNSADYDQLKHLNAIKKSIEAQLQGVPADSGPDSSIAITPTRRALPTNDSEVPTPVTVPTTTVKDLRSADERHLDFFTKERDRLKEHLKLVKSHNDPAADTTIMSIEWDIENLDEEIKALQGKLKGLSHRNSE